MLYVALWRITLQEALQYRVEAAIWFLFDILPPIMMAFLWLAAYESQASVAGYDLSSMLLYTLGVMILRTVITAHTEWGIDHEIRQGILSTYLVRPFSYWAFCFVAETAWKAVRAMLITPVLIACLIWLGPHLRMPALGWSQVPPLLLSLVLAYVLCFFVKLCLGFLCFWATDIGGIATLYEVVVYVFGGVLLPLDLLPEPLQAVAAALPLRYIYYVPLSLLLGRLDGPGAWAALATQLGWIGVMALVAGVLWRHGLRRYEAVGG
jgi:ABC-2 type transport system permease protein